MFQVPTIVECPLKSLILNLYELILNVYFIVKNGF